MRDNIYENPINPLDPQWYHDAFDQFISVADSLLNHEEIVSQGYVLPDVDGSKSSLFRNNAVLNNSFNEEILRDTLKELYLNSTPRLIASNNATVNFFQWHGYISEAKIIPNTNVCEIKIPWNIFITQQERDIFKLSKFHNNWIKVEDILNNWKIFKWHLMLFVDKRIYSEYEIFIDEQDVIIRFPYNDYWMKMNHSISIYKFDTNYQKRILISKELCEKQWNWKMPLEVIGDKAVFNHDKFLIAINKISDTSIRRDGLTRVEVLGDNLEFIPVKDGIIDLNMISQSNKNYILSEIREWLALSIIVPKYFHEYPIMLPTDVIHRPYIPGLKEVLTFRADTIQKLKATDEKKQVYIDLKGDILERYNGWHEMIRPIVLSDAYEGIYNEPLDQLDLEIREVRDAITIVADDTSNFRFFIEDGSGDKTLDQHLNLVSSDMKNLYEAHRGFYQKKLADPDYEFIDLYEKSYLPAIEDIRINGENSYWFNPPRYHDDLWAISSKIINIARKLIDQYYSIEILKNMPRRYLWGDPKELSQKIRFQRPIEESNFMIFEYNQKKSAWYPTDMKVTRHFPDVYLLNDPTADKIDTSRIFKAFFFYSDTMNILEETRDIKDPSVAWDENVMEYYYEPAATYRDLFMERFYWVGIRSIYKGLLMTNTRWEAIEHIIDNSSYQRFNDLFLKTMDPYFKLGLATYLKSANFEFPFDDAISKFEEAMSNNRNNYKNVTNFEAYLNKQWIPSYFDYIITIIDNWDFESRIIRRPSYTFDMKRLLAPLINIAGNITDVTKQTLEDSRWVLKELEDETFNLNVDEITHLKDIIEEMLSNMSFVMDFIREMDLDVFSIDDINLIIDRLTKQNDYILRLQTYVDSIRDNINTNNIYEDKRSKLTNIQTLINSLYKDIDETAHLLKQFDMKSFMLVVNDLRGYLEFNKFNDDDISAIGEINEFKAPWSDEVKTARNNLYLSTNLLNSSYDPKKVYSDEEVTIFTELVNRVDEDITRLMSAIEVFSILQVVNVDQNLIDRLEHSQTLIRSFNLNTQEYYTVRNKLLEDIIGVNKLFDEYDENYLSANETILRATIQENLRYVVDCLSYVAGENRKDEADKTMEEINGKIKEWLSLIDYEEKIFDILMRITKEPSPFIDTMLSNQSMMEALIEYMNTVRDKYIPDLSWPTYSDVFEIDTIEIESRGFRHKVGDNIFIPRLGTYKVASIVGDVSQIENVEEVKYRKTTFRDPTIQTMGYGSITDGAGSGFSIRAIRSKRTPITNDGVILPLIEKIDNSLKNVHRYITLPNPHNNTEFNIILTTIPRLLENWEHLNGIYGGYMSDEIRNHIDNLIIKLQLLVPPSQAFIEQRMKLDISEFAESFRELMNAVYRQFTILALDDEDFYYHDNSIRVTFNDFLSYIGTGTSWNDTDRLTTLLNEMREILWIYPKNLIPRLPDDDENKNNFTERFQELDNRIISMKEAIVELPLYVTPIKDALDQISAAIAEVPKMKLHNDLWYRINNVLPAVFGSGYQVGDIVQIIPEINMSDGTTINGYWKKWELVPLSNFDIERIVNNEWDDEDEDPMTEVILNDVVLFQITKVDEGGRVLSVKPMMDYSLPYLLWGIRQTITRTGNGVGLSIDIFSSEVTLEDSTILNTDTSYQNSPAQFGENELIQFKFENTHDLNINYEVFLAGKQITNFIQRHEEDYNSLHPTKMDVLYLNANDVLGLRNSSISIPAEQYFVYKINEIIIKDPGAGYAVGQDILIDANYFALRLRVASLIYGPTKGIDTITISNGNTLFRDQDPSGEDKVVAPDSLNNIDDEFNVGFYDKIPKEGILQAGTNEYDKEEYPFTSLRQDDLDGDDRNLTFMYPSVDMVVASPDPSNGDPEHHWYQGSRIDNSQHPMKDDKWNGIINVIPPTHPFIPDDRRFPNGQPPRGEYQEVDNVRLHNYPILSTSINAYPEILSHTGGGIDLFVDIHFDSDSITIADLSVNTYADLPKHTIDWPEGAIGKKVSVEHDETKKGHRTIYRIRGFVATGYFIYNLPVLADHHWNTIDIDWMKTDWYPDKITTKQIYPNAPWREMRTFREIQEFIDDGRVLPEDFHVRFNTTSYIHNLTMDDLSVFNWTTKKWENLNDEKRWKLDVYNDDDQQYYGFRLTFLDMGIYSYDMQLYLNKVPTTQLKNASIKRSAVMDISASIIEEVDKPAIRYTVNTGRTVRIRKLFPYEQKERFTIGFDRDNNPLGYEMDFKLAPYIHFKNQLHLQDVKIYNRTADRFENILDRNLFEVRFKDSKALSRGYETETRIVQTLISQSGDGFGDGPVWGWNREFGIHIFGKVTADVDNNIGNILTFTPTHCPNPPLEDMGIAFDIYQTVNQSDINKAIVLIEFKTEKLEVYGDGYIHEVSNPLAPLPDEFKIIAQYQLNGPYEYDVIISKSAKVWSFVENEWILAPTFHIPNDNIPQDRLYIMSEKGRYPLINPSTFKPSFQAIGTEEGTDVHFLNLYRRFEHIEIRSVPYPMRSVYIQRRIPSHGFIDLKGRLNKPLNKKYFEFWMNGRLLGEEVTIISPSKLVLHGLKSLRNFEIIEINRDQNEFFSDIFLESSDHWSDRKINEWNFNTYLDDALGGDLKGENYTLDEQKLLLSPVWPQVDSTHPSFKDFPPNVDEEEDIISMIHTSDLLMKGFDSTAYQFTMLDLPTLEGIQITGNMSFPQFGFRPIDENFIIELLNEEWSEEIIKDPYFHPHVLISDADWYGTTARLYDEYGIRVHTLDESVYHVSDFNLLNVDMKYKSTSIIKTNRTYDLN